jgi:uncharacterized membrane protein
MFNHLYRGGWATSGYGFGFPWGGIVMGILIIGLGVLAVIAIIKINKTEKLGIKTSNQRAFEILAERFARGEIDAEAFRSMKVELEAKA